MTLEYKTKFYPLTLYRTYSLDPESKDGFVRVWADVTDEGTFVVYRRAVKDKKKRAKPSPLLCPECGNTFYGCPCGWREPVIKAKFL